MLVVVAFSGCDQRPALLKPVDLRSSIYLARYETHIVISPSGYLRSVTTSNKTYGPNDKAGPARTEVREGQLSAQQMAELSRLFAGWDSIAGAYASVADGGEVEIRYGNKSVTGNQLPKRAEAVQRQIQKFAESMPRVEER